MRILSFLGKKQVLNSQKTYSGRAVVYNDSITGKGQDKVLLWFADSQGRMPSIGQKLKERGIESHQICSVARIAYCPHETEIQKRFCIIDYSSERNLNQMGENGRFDKKATLTKENDMKMQDARLILDMARQMKRLPTHSECAAAHHPLKSSERAWNLFNKKRTR